MQKNINYGAIISVILAIVLVAGAYWSYSANSDLRDTLNAKENALTTSQENSLILGYKVDELGKKIVDLQTEIQAKESELEREVEVEIVEKGYLIDGVFIGLGLDEILTSKHIDLFKGEVEVNGEDYKFEEKLYLNGLNVTANGKDYGSNVYSVINKGEIRYAVEFKNVVKNISSDEPLIFNFLGNEVQIVGWNGNEITMKYVDSQVISEGQVLTIDGKNVVVNFITADSVYFVVDGVGKNIKENNTRTVNGIKIAVSDVLYSEKQTSKAVVRIGENLQEEFETGNEYKEDSIWNWNITDKSIGIVLDETFKWLDDDNRPLGIGDKICLPNEYKCVQFKGLEEVSYQDISFKVRDNGDLRITGDNIKLEVYNGTTQFYDTKEKENLSEIELENSDLIMNISGNRIQIVDKTDNKVLLSIFLNVTNVKVDNDSVIVEREDDYRSSYGIIVRDTEDIAEKQVLDILVPEEKVSASFLIY